MNNSDLTFLILSVCISLGIIFTAWIRKLLIKADRLDRPNERSSHTIPVPRGGGWGLLMVIVPGMILTGILQDNFVGHNCIIAGVIILALISWLDDSKGVPPLSRLAIHILVAAIGTMAFGTHDLIFSDHIPFWLDRIIMVLGWAWFMNIYNFMDGIDGLTGVETITIATGTCVLMSAIGINDPYIEVLTLILTGTCLGFLSLNWHPAKIFLGDVGSVPLGYLTGYVLLTLVTKGYLIPALILPLYYLADSGITITKRALKKEKIWQPHRQHFYQRAALAAGRHDKVVFYIIVGNIGLLIAALAAVFYPLPSLAAAIAVVAILLAKLHKVAGTND